MIDKVIVTKQEIIDLYNRIKNDAENGGYLLNPDSDFTMPLIEGLAVNIKRYGYQSCPCRLAEGVKQVDLDIICPCDYRDSDISDYGSCFCALYVSRDILENKKKLTSIPERRNKHSTDIAFKKPVELTGLKYPIWRCSVCGYICARELPPEICPICKVSKDRFERLL